MKTAVLLILALLSIAFCQEIETYNFASLQWGTQKAEVMKLLTEKSYTFNQKLTNEIDMDRTYCFEGNVVGEEAFVFVGFDNNNKLVKCFITLFVDEDEVIRKYESVRTTLINKYGEPKETYEMYEYPYELGDGYEEQAIRLGKAHYATFWENAKDRSGLYLQISKSLCVYINYESSDWAFESKKIKTKEAEDL